MLSPLFFGGEIHTGGVCEQANRVEGFLNMFNRRLLSIIVILALLGGSLALPGATAKADMLLRNWVYHPNSNVYDFYRNGDLLYIAGEFSYLGPESPRFSVLEPATNSPATGWPAISGTPYVIIPDGVGGWYVGGDFTHVGGKVQPYLARVKPDKSVDLTFAPVIDGPVYALLRFNNALYIGGSFQNVNSTARKYGASLNPSTGAFPASSWDPNFDGTVKALATDGTLLYVGGGFVNANGNQRKGLAAYNTAHFLQSWNPKIGGVVNSIVVHGTNVYFGGTFTTVGMVNRKNFAAVHKTTGAYIAFGSEPNNGVEQLALDTSVTPPVVYVVGAFQNVGGTERFGGAAFRTDTGALTSWNPAVEGAIRAIAISGNVTYIGGTFTSVNEGKNRKYLAQLDKVTGMTTPWAGDANGNVSALAANANQLAVGGAFGKVGGRARERLAAIDMRTGIPTDFNLKINGMLRALAGNGTHLYIGGNFVSVEGNPRDGIAGIDLATGNVTSFNPDFDAANVRGLVLDGTTLYVGGAFSTVGGITRRSLAAFDLTTNTLLPFNANLPAGGTTVNALLLNKGANILYIGSAGPTTFTAVHPTTGAAAAGFSATVTGPVETFALHNNVLYIGGSISAINGTSRAWLGAVNATTGTLDTFAPSVDGHVNDFALFGNKLVTVGIFSMVNGSGRKGVASFDLPTGALTDFAANFNPPIIDMLSVIYASPYLFVGHSFNMFAFADSDLTQEGVGVFRPSNSTTYVRNIPTGGAPNATIKFGISTDVPLAGDWNLDNLDTVGVWRASNGRFYLTNSTKSVNAAPVNYEFAFGLPGDIPIVGDWDGDGIDTVGVFRPSQKKFYLRNNLSAGPVHITITFGLSGDIPVVGDWDGNGIDTVGVWRPSNKTFYLTNTGCNGCTGKIDASQAFGLADDLPVVGDWDGNMTTGIGVFRPSTKTFHIKNTTSPFELPTSFAFGLTGDKPLAGHWANLVVFDEAPAAPSFVPRK